MLRLKSVTSRNRILVKLKEEADISWPFHAIYSILFGQDTWSAGICAQSLKLLRRSWDFFAIFRMHYVLLFSNSSFLLILETDLNEYSYWKIWDLSNCRNYWENFNNSGKSFDNVILIQFSLLPLKNETCSNLC